MHFIMTKPKKWPQGKHALASNSLEMDPDQSVMFQVCGTFWGHFFFTVLNHNFWLNSSLRSQCFVVVKNAFTFTVVLYVLLTFCSFIFFQLSSLTLPKFSRAFLPHLP